MAQRPIAVRLQAIHDERVEEGQSIVVGVTEAASRMGVSERTVFRLLKTGKLERAVSSDMSDMASFNVSHNDVQSVTMKTGREINRPKSNIVMSGIEVKNDRHDRHDELKGLKQEIVEKDRQIAELRLAQQEMTATIHRLQDHMYELAHLVLTQNVAAAQARAEAEVKAQEQNQPGRRGLASLLGGRGKRS